MIQGVQKSRLLTVVEDVEKECAIFWLSHICNMYLGGCITGFVIRSLPDKNTSAPADCQYDIQAILNLLIHNCLTIG